MAILTAVVDVPPEDWTLKEAISRLRGIGLRVGELEVRLRQLRSPLSEPFEPILEFIQQEEAEIDKVIEALEIRSDPDEGPVVELEDLTKAVKSLFN